MDFVTQIAGHNLEYIDDGHLYLVDGALVKSITQMLKYRFGSMYNAVSEKTLQTAAEKGTAVHEAIEMYCVTGQDDRTLKELQNFKFLMKKYNFEVIRNEVPVILFDGDEPIAAGRLDMVLRKGGIIGGADVKRTSQLYKDYVTFQLNLYRIAYRQCYGVEWKFLRVIHLREDVRRYVTIPIIEDETWQFIREYEEAIR